MVGFKGIAHPPPRRDGKRSNMADLNAAEISMSRAGARGLPGRPVLVEHDPAGGQVGMVLTSWEGPSGELRVEGVVNDPVAAGLVQSGQMRELSLGTSVHSEENGRVLMRTHDELSICAKAARPGCIITEIDGKQVGSSHHFSKTRGARASRYVDKPLGPTYLLEDKPTVAMSDADSAAATLGSASSVAETFSADYVAKLKAELEAKSQSEAVLKSKFAVHEERQRAQLTELQPAVKAWITEGLEAGAEYKHEMQSMVGFGDSLHQASNIDSAMPLARMISCHSAKIKREREEFSQASGAADALGKANKEIDVLKESDVAKTKRIEELEGLVNERTSAAEKLQEVVSKAGLVQEKFDFSNAASRETAPGSSSAPAAKVHSSGPFVDPLLAFVSKGSYASSGRIGLSATNHHILGAGGAGDSGIEAALRMA